ncbi:FAD-dependent oxidoreductase [Sagittula sp. S175]|uniref:flavin monoamine oxidase family protein n=1 Tax=Sagittula sp. S175 TaxID=3415129 RepID=UPI003C7CCB7D
MRRRDGLRVMGAAALWAALPTGVGAGTRQPTGYLRTNWSRDPLALGSYSFDAAGARAGDRAALAEPVAGRLFFAGEAAHPEYNSTVHAALESGELAAEALMETEAERVAVIGAGVAGLAAAQMLTMEGLDVTVIEARDRIGGRILTDRSLGLPLDLGASWLHGTAGNPLTQRADALGLERVETGEQVLIRGGDGRLIADDDAPDWLEAVASVQHGLGADADEVDVDRTEARDAADYDGPEQVFPGGYDGILRSFDGDYAIRTGSPVTQVRLTAGGVSVEGEAFDACIVTVSLGVLKSGAIRFDPPLPEDKRAAIDRLGMGVLDKLYLRFDAPFWDVGPTWLQTPETGLPEGQFNEWLNLQALLGVPVLVAFNGGSAARDLSGLDDAALLARALSVLDRAWG